MDGFVFFVCHRVAFSASLPTVVTLLSEPENNSEK